MGTEEYSVAVRIKLMNELGAGLNIMSRQLRTAQGDVDGLQARLDQIKKTAASGAFMLGAGVGLGMMFKAPLEDARKLQTEMARFASLGFGDAVNSQAARFALGMNTFGTSLNDNMTLLSDAMAVFKNLHHAEFAAPLMAKMKFSNEAVFGKEGGGANERKFMDMLKVIEFRGGLASEHAFSTQADYVQKVIAGSRGRVDASQMLQALRTGSVALSRRSNEQFYLGSEPLIQEFGGQRYGTGAMSIYQNLVQSHGTITAQQELYRLGLLDKSMVEFNQLGKLKKALPGAFVGSDILERKGEMALLQEVLLPAFAKKGITGEEAIIRELGMILGNRTGSGLMSRIYQQMPTLQKQIEANKSAMGIDALDKTARGTVDGQMIELHKQWNTLMTQLGVTLLPDAIGVLKSANSLLKDFNQYMKDDGQAVRALTKDLFYLAPALAIGGTIKLTTAAFQGFGLAADLAKLRSLRGADGIKTFAGAIGDVERIGRVSAVAGGVGNFTSKLAGLAGKLGEIGLLYTIADTAAHLGYDMGHQWMEERKKAEREADQYHPGQGLGVMDNFQPGPTKADAQRRAAALSHLPGDPYQPFHPLKGNTFQFSNPADVSGVLRGVMASLPPPAAPQVNVKVVLGTKEVAAQVVTDITRQATRPPVTGNGIDKTMGLPYPSAPSISLR